MHFLLQLVRDFAICMHTVYPPEWYSDGPDHAPFLAMQRFRKHLLTKVFPKLQTAQIEKLTSWKHKYTSRRTKIPKTAQKVNCLGYQELLSCICFKVKHSGKLLLDIYPVGRRSWKGTDVEYQECLSSSGSGSGSAGNSRSPPRVSRVKCLAVQVPADVPSTPPCALWTLEAGAGTTDT